MRNRPVCLRSLLLTIAALAIMVSCRNPPSPPPQGTPTISSSVALTAPPETALRLPVRANSVRFAVIGDAGRGDQAQYEVSARMQSYRKIFPFDFVVMAGDNVYDGGSDEDYRQKFELPYKPLLDAGVKFFAAIGNHDDPNQPFYKPFNMGGERYYSFVPPSLLSRVLGARVRFFMLDTERLDATQLAWADKEMAASDADWDIAVFHRPLYTSGRYEWSAWNLRRSLAPLLIRHGVQVAISGHEHFYERIRPQDGITYFISGGAGSLRPGEAKPSGIAAARFDRDYHFMLFEIDDDDLFYQAIARSGETVDSGTVTRRPAH